MNILIPSPHIQKEVITFLMQSPDFVTPNTIHHVDSPTETDLVGMHAINVVLVNLDGDFSLKRKRDLDELKACHSAALTGLLSTLKDIPPEKFAERFTYVFYSQEMSCIDVATMPVPVDLLEYCRGLAQKLQAEFSSEYAMVVPLFSVVMGKEAKTVDEFDAWLKTSLLRLADTVEIKFVPAEKTAEAAPKIKPPPFLPKDYSVFLAEHRSVFSYLLNVRDCLSYLTTLSCESEEEKENTKTYLRATPVQDLINREIKLKFDLTFLMSPEFHQWRVRAEHIGMKFRLQPQVELEIVELACVFVIDVTLERKA